MVREIRERAEEQNLFEDCGLCEGCTGGGDCLYRLRYCTVLYFDVL